MLHPALLVRGRHADVQLVAVRQNNDAASAVVREALTDGQEPRPFDVESSQCLDVDVLRYSAADMAVGAGVSLAERKDVDAARVGYNDAVVAAAVDVDDALGPQTREVSGRHLLLTGTWIDRQTTPHINFAVLRQSSPKTVQSP